MIKLINKGDACGVCVCVCVGWGGGGGFPGYPTFPKPINSCRDFGEARRAITNDNDSS